ncbi:hypothetical protein HMPREF9071_1531 [Capnocytophaga sp. oral taxon 338 str. F0234]|jgi:hypothetical protein|nr:hypothetical protein HMPREF9071_1531 [Capnocytophaga sp. oral taxon 338 str. F0234]
MTMTISAGKVTTFKIFFKNKFRKDIFFQLFLVYLLSENKKCFLP